MKSTASVALVSLALLAGCATNPPAETYSVGVIGQARRVVPATVVNARPVAVQTSGAVGATAGASSGALAGGLAGAGSRAGVIGAVGGAIVGAAIGAAVEQAITRQPALEYTVETENGVIVQMVQPSAEPFVPGSRVLLVYGQPTRIIRAD